MAYSCDDCGAHPDVGYRFLQGGNELHFCQDCWESFPPRPKVRKVLTYDIDLQSLPGIGLALARRICRRWWKGDDRVAMLRDNAYLLTELPGLGFMKADIIALHLGLSPQSPRRAEAATRYVLDEAARKDGHTWLPMSVLAEGVREFGLEAQVNQDVLIVVDDGIVEPRVARKRLYQAEQYVAKKLVSMVEEIGAWPNEIDYADLQDDQRKALVNILQNRIYVLLGAAGTGKTTALKTVLDNLNVVGGFHVALCAPTGKAARRMSETTGVPAKTIHRLLEATPNGDGGFYFERDEDNPLEANFIVVDEASMCDVRLMQSLMKAIPAHARVLFVGDPWQLPSVGPGDVLRDLTSGHERIPYSILTILKRQDPAHLLAANCARVRAGQMVEVNNEAMDFFFADIGKPADIIEEIVSLVAERIPAKWKVPTTAVQVLAALRERGEVSCGALNHALRARLNPGAKDSKDFEPGDRVIQTQNDYELGIEGVMNGECGNVLVAARRKLSVKFDNISEPVEIPMWQRHLDFAWALTCHKAQGSEFAVVVIPIHKSNGMLIPRRRWMYTALSRGKQATIVIGDRAELAKIVQRSQDIHRFTWLGKFLSEGPGGTNAPVTNNNSPPSSSPPVVSFSAEAQVEVVGSED